MDTPPSELEPQIALCLTQSQHERAAVLTLRAYGDDLLSYLLTRLHDEEQAREVFSMFAEDLWTALPSLALRTTMRAYCYALARHAAHRYLQRDLRKQRRAVPISAADVISKVMAQPRTATAPHARSENQRHVAALRARLSPEEQELLTLRIDRGLAWNEVAEALADTEQSDSDAKVDSARHRKRFQLIKQKLARWAREAGIVSPRDD